MLSQNRNSTVIYNVGDVYALRKLILSAKKGDTEAFEKVYKQLFTPLYKYTFSRCSNEELAKDISQQVFLKFYQALPSYEPDKSPLAYLFTIAKHLLINQKEKDFRISFDESLLDNEEDKSTNLLDEAHIKLLSEKINEFLPSLTNDEQDVIRLHFYSELGFKEISEIINKEEVYIRKIKERALKKLRILTSHLYE